MLRKLTMKLLFLILPIVFADEIIYAYKLNFIFGLQNHVTLSRKESAILNQTTVWFTVRATSSGFSLTKH